MHSARIIIEFTPDSLVNLGHDFRHGEHILPGIGPELVVVDTVDGRRVEQLGHRGSLDAGDT